MNQSDVLVARQLFDQTAFSGITSFMSNEMRFMPLAIDSAEFVRKYAHNNPFFVDIHHQLTEFASYQFGEALKPSYVFLSIYQDGGTCPLHLDRPQCYRTVDYLISQDSDDAWPISISRMLSDQEVAEFNNKTDGRMNDEIKKQVIDEQEWETVLLAPNDAVLYSGTNSWHYRPTKLVGTAALAFFHFVPKDFDGPLD